jgi:hypothetical protein
MDDEPMYDNYDQSAGGSESEPEEDDGDHEEPEETLEQSPGEGESGNSETGVKTEEQTPNQGNETQQGGNTALGINGEQFQRANLNNLQPLNSNTTPNTGNGTSTSGMIAQIVCGGSLYTQANFAPPPAAPEMPRPHLVSNMEVKMNGGGEFEMEEMDLSAYGGAKPAFDIKERDDDKAIENLNAELLGIQTGGDNEKMEKAINHGVQQTLDNAVATQQPGIMFGGTPQTPITPVTPANNGLNFSFNQQNNNMQMGGNSNMMPRKTVSFNDQVKVVELDTKISEGFMYSGSNNLDPFRV